MKVEDVMTTDVVAVGPDTPLRTVARELAERRISGLPVVDERGEVLGVVSEADILAKEQDVPPRRHGALGRILDAIETDEHVKLEARTAGQAMTSPAVTIAPYRSVASAAREMLERGVNRLPVVRSGRLVGIVTRADLVRAFARADDVIAAEVREQIAYLLALESDPSQVDATISEGEVTLTGGVRRRSTAETLPRMAASVPGVVGTRSTLTWSEDDSRPARRSGPESRLSIL